LPVNHYMRLQVLSPAILKPGFWQPAWRAFRSRPRLPLPVRWLR
jgi:hypothetical protein